MNERTSTFLLLALLYVASYASAIIKHDGPGAINEIINSLDQSLAQAAILGGKRDELETVKTGLIGRRELGKKKAPKAKATKAPVTAAPTYNPTAPPTGAVVYPSHPLGRKYLKVVIVFDASAVARLGGSARIGDRASSILKRVKTIFNELPPLSFQVSEIHYWSTTDETRALGGVAFREDNTHLGAFNSWRVKTIKTEHALGHMFTGEAMQNIVDDRVYATKRSACNNDIASSLSSIYGQDDDDLIAKCAAHAIAHTLGLEHLSLFGASGITMTDAMTCLKDQNEVMQTGKIIEQNPKIAAWSVCSKKYLSTYFTGFPSGCKGSSCITPPIYDGRHDYAACMETPVEDKVPFCGDGVVQASQGEQCDCGDATQCRDKCCDPTTCRFKPNSKCSANDPCCDPNTCSPFGAAENVVCRPAKSSCDQPDTCNGSSKDCPADVFLPFGSTCVTSDERPGTCGMGVCRNHLEQCLYQSQNPLTKVCPLAKVTNPCFRLPCLLPGSKTCTAMNVMMEDGTTCGKDKLCVNGQCLLGPKLLG